MKKLLLVLAIFFPTNIFAIEFDGKFIQGHFILGKTDPNSKLIIDKKNVKVSRMVILFLELIEIGSLMF